MSAPNEQVSDDQDDEAPAVMVWELHTAITDRVPPLCTTMWLAGGLVINRLLRECAAGARLGRMNPPDIHMSAVLLALGMWSATYQAGAHKPRYLSLVHTEQALIDHAHARQVAALRPGGHYLTDDRQETLRPHDATRLNEALGGDGQLLETWRTAALAVVQDCIEDYIAGPGRHPHDRGSVHPNNIPQIMTQRVMAGWYDDATSELIEVAGLRRAAGEPRG